MNLKPSRLSWVSRFVPAHSTLESRLRRSSGEPPMRMKDIGELAKNPYFISGIRRPSAASCREFTKTRISVMKIRAIPTAQSKWR